MLPLRVFVGYDEKEIVAYHVFCQSVIQHSTIPVCFVPLSLRSLGLVFSRPRHPNQSTDFAFSRFLVPFLSGYEGWSLFMDGDMLVRRDVAELFSLRNPAYAIQVVKHDYVPKGEVKFLGNVQLAYPMKNWSSVILFNNAKCRALSPHFVSSASGLELHQFKWIDDDELIGSLPIEWNHLVGEYPYFAEAANVHFTMGGPYFAGYESVEYAHEWRDALKAATSSGTRV
jgi:hypothetical protein